VPNGISEKFLNPSIQCEKIYDICFVGNLSYPPNIESCRFIYKEIVKKMPDLKVLFSGANPVKEIQEMKAPNLELRSWVEDIRTSYLESRILVAPMFISTGMQNKILESMALGVPCITTPMANNAVAANDGKEILLANQADEFREKINYLLANPSYSEEISRNAKKWVEERYKWDKTTEILMESCFQDNTEEK
jgi:glycosyltransferase involved in cell wall biosynthesis